MRGLVVPGPSAGPNVGRVGRKDPEGWPGALSGSPVPCETVLLRVRGCPLNEVKPAINVAVR
jgi:hypothetical protein